MRAANSRRLLGKRVLTLGGIAMLSGCDLSNDNSVNTMLRRISFFNDHVQALLFKPNEMAPTYPESMITRPFPLNAFYGIDDVPQIDAATYRLQVSGLVNGNVSGHWKNTAPCRRKARSLVISASKDGVRSADGAACASPVS
jgi:DMSO/TMAO reductase YedYZ molybdopterin-dependent catalytic subunit